MTPMPDPLQDLPSWELIESYLDDPAASPDIGNWASEHPVRQRWLASLRAAWRGHWSADGKHPNLEALSAGVRSRLVASPASSRASAPVPAHTERRRLRLIMGMGLAAIALVVAAVGLLSYTGWGRTDVSYATTPGRQLRVMLPDGSAVLMAPDSRIRYTQDRGGNRDVHLDGEALFTVLPAADMPFVVHTIDAPTRVLGTAFTVRRYATDPVTRIVVAEGKVAVHDRVVVSGEIAYAVTGQETRVFGRARIADALAWTTGRIVVRRQEFRDVRPQLERWYGIRIIVTDDRLLDRLMTATFETAQADQLIEKLAILLNASVEYRNSELIVSSQ